MKCVVSVLGKDRSGIVAEVATALAACGANIDDISQTILDDIFSMTMLTTLNLQHGAGEAGSCGRIPGCPNHRPARRRLPDDV